MAKFKIVTLVEFIFEVNKALKDIDGDHVASMILLLLSIYSFLLVAHRSATRGRTK